MERAAFSRRKSLVASAVGALAACMVFFLAQFNTVSASTGSITQTPSTLPAFGATLTTLTPPTAVSTPTSSSVGTPAPAPQIVPTNPPQVSDIPTTPCSISDLQAAVSGMGIPSMQDDQDIVTVSSSTSCFLSGYPDITLSSSGSPLAVQFEDDGVTGRFNPLGPVALGPGLSASFVMQYPDETPNCPTATDMTFSIAGSADTVDVSFSPTMIQYQSGWYICGDGNVSAFEQGSDPGQYVPAG